MRKSEFIVPEGIQYISDWDEYKLPRGEHCIVDKGVTGCGYTEFCLRNEDNVVLCSPRKLLLLNKAEQHQKDRNILYLKFDNYGDPGLLDKIECSILSHISMCRTEGLAIKFLITYDSTYHLTKFLKSIRLLDEFIFVIDEFQSIFLDSYFKSGIEIDFVDYLQICKSVIYLSATPMLDEYLADIDEFKDLNFYYLNWDNTGFVEKIKLQRKKTNYLGTECGKIITNYLNGKFPIMYDSNGDVIESREAVFYFNSVSDIIRVIKNTGLTPLNTLIICSETESNISKLKKVGFTLGKVPLKGEPNPMFTFCTSAVYMGVDFYSSCASSFIFADPNVDCLALDISLDLPQIIGRQRDKSNPFKNNIIIFYKIKRKGEKRVTREEFLLVQKERKEKTERLLDIYYNQLKDPNDKQVFLDKLISDIEYSNYSKDFVGISRRTGLPMKNSLIEVASRRAWDVSREEYQDDLTVTKALRKAKLESTEYLSENDMILKNFLDNYFYATGVFEERMQLYCEFRDQFSDNSEIIEGLENRVVDSKFSTYYKFYGTEGCRSRKFRDSEMLKGLQLYFNDTNLEKEIHKEFSLGQRVSKSEIKEKLKIIYSNLMISKSAKATDLKEYFKLVKTNITLPDKTVVNGFRLDPLDG